MPRCSARVEQQFGVPTELIVAIWGLETDFGTGDMGKLPVVRALATMAHDCRRTELFQRELIAALQDRAARRPDAADMLGAYAGELGQTQFLPSSYIKYAVDYDGNGHVDLRRSVPDVLASTANLLKGNGWQPGAAVRRGHAEFRGDARVEPARGLSQDDRLFRAAARGAVSRPKPARFAAQGTAGHIGTFAWRRRASPWRSPFLIYFAGIGTVVAALAYRLRRRPVSERSAEG